MSQSLLTPAQEKQIHVWRRHTYAEFVTKDIEAALATMVQEPHLLLVPTGLGGVGRTALREFYAKRFIPQIPADMQPIPISLTVGIDRIVEESIYKFTHDIEMQWLLPGVAPTGKSVVLPVTAVVGFDRDKIAHQHLYFDQATLLIQIEVLQPGVLPMNGVESAHKLLAAMNM
jgi:carboxymethylenebutenolidase